MSLPEGWSRQVSRNTGKVYFFNSLNGASTYDPAEMFKLSPPLPINPDRSDMSLHHMPPPHNQPQGSMKPSNVSQQLALGPQQLFKSMVSSMNQVNNNQLGMGGCSVSELQMMLAEKKRQLAARVQEMEAGEASSEESGIGSMEAEARGNIMGRMSISTRILPSNTNKLTNFEKCFMTQN